MQEWQPPPSSPLPVALALMGTFAPLLILGSDPAIQAERLAWALAASLLAGLVSASVGVALRSSNLWLSFWVMGASLGTAFGTLVACATFSAAGSLLVLVVPIAFGCGVALTFASAGVFAAHRRALATRAGSMLQELDRSWVLTAAFLSLVLLAFVVSVVFHPTHVVLLVSTGASAGVVLGVLLRRRRFEALSAVVRRAGAMLDERDAGVERVDLGVGDERYLLRDAGDAYRSPGVRPEVVLGSLAQAHRRARRLRRLDAVAAAAAVSLSLFVGLSAFLEPPSRALEVATRPPAVALPSPPLATGSWYPGQAPLLIDVNHDSRDDVVSLRWQSSRPESALSIAAHDGASLEPLWVSDPVPSQWMSADTRLVQSGSALFLTTSEHRVYFYDVRTGHPLREPKSVDSVASLCVPPKDEAEVWLLDAGAWSKKRPGLLLAAHGGDVVASRPPDCRPAARALGSLRQWDGRCQKKLQSREGLSGSAFFKQDTIGLAVDGTGPVPLAVGYDPATCSQRWRSSLLLSEEEPHQSPRLSYRLDGSELFVMYQLASGAWTVGARDAQSGRISWQQSLPQAERGTNVEALFPAGDRVYVARDWRLDVLDAGDGRYLGRI